MDVLPFPDDLQREKTRFQIELEFVQCLANPHYLNFLAQRGYFKDKSFVNYLKYLLYWKQPEYIQFIKYPYCLHFLDLLQYESFRKELVDPALARFIDDQEILFWQQYTRQRLQMISANHPGNESAKPAVEKAVESS